MAYVGAVREFNVKQGFGFLEADQTIDASKLEGAPEDAKVPAGQGIFVHSTSIRAGEGMVPSLESGERVRFDVQWTQKGVQAVGVVREDGEEIRPSTLHRVELKGVCCGLVDYWNESRGYGWIQCEVSRETLRMHRVPERAMDLNSMKVYVQRQDLAQNLKEMSQGLPVIFNLYWDEKGLGATNITIGHGIPLDREELNTSLQRVQKRFEKLAAASKENRQAALGSLDNITPQAHVKLLIPKAAVGSVIGLKGQTVKKFLEESGAVRVHVDDLAKQFGVDGAQQGRARAIGVHGSFCAVAKAVNLITVALATDPEDNPGEGAPTPDQPAPRRERANWVIKFMVPHVLVPFVTGPKNEFLDKLAEKTGTKLSPESTNDIPAMGMIDVIVARGPTKGEEGREECLDVLSARIAAAVGATLEPRITALSPVPKEEKGAGRAADPWAVGGKGGWQGGGKGWDNGWGWQDGWKGWDDGKGGKGYGSGKSKGDTSWKGGKGAGKGEQKGERKGEQKGEHKGERGKSNGKGETKAAEPKGDKAKGRGRGAAKASATPSETPAKPTGAKVWKVKDAA
mmetsp:Transcript_16781/g.37032  ORF Transcript_16781/g.37032 Transcript_16781/m.37032 type:complete len:569 (+) Transcript_16781:175-1881(+)